MKLIKIYLFLLMVGLSAVSCEKNGVSELKETAKRSGVPIPTLLQYYNEISGHKDGYCGIESFATYATQDIERANFDGRFWDNGNNTLKSVGSIAAGSVVINPNTQNTYTVVNDNLIGLYGETVTFKIETKTPSFYVPHFIRFESPVMTQNSTLGPNQTITWNKDANNTKGVIIKITYHPDDNTTHKALGYDKIIIHPILVSDIGQYTFAANDFPGIPDGAEIDITLIRANYDRITLDGGDDILVYAYTRVRGTVMYDAN